MFTLLFPLEEPTRVGQGEALRASTSRKPQDKIGSAISGLIPTLYIFLLPLLAGGGPCASLLLQVL